jgi:hypothetical protein
MPQIYFTAAYVVLQIRYLCSKIARQSKEGKSCNIFYAYRCMTMDILTYLCYGNSINAMDEPDFKAPLVEAMHTVTPLSPMLQHFSLYKSMIQNIPPKISIKLSPETAGLVRMQQVGELERRQFTELTFFQATQTSNRPACQRPKLP